MKTGDPMIDAIMGSVDAQTDRMCADAGQMTLGEMEARLENMPQDKPVRFEDGWYPGELDSYRGYYRMIAIEPTTKECSVGGLLGKVTAAIGGTFEGYKGGDFTMTRHTPVWVSAYGCSSNDGVVRVVEQTDHVLLETARIESED